MRACLGIDIGGTAMKAGLITEDGEALRPPVSASTPQPATPDAVVDQIARFAEELAPRAGVSSLISIGIGIPGRVDPRRGLVSACANLGEWYDVPLGEKVSQRLGAPVVLANDANAAALAEYHRAAQDRPDLRHAALVTLGTGIGAGLVLDGRLFTGGSEMAGEIGHLIVEVGGERCACGQRGCLERYASASAVARATRQRLEQRGATVPAGFGAREVFDLADRGDADAIAVLDRAAQLLALGLVNLTRVLDLQVVLLGGGMAAAGERFLGPVRDAVRSLEWTMLPSAMQIQAAQLGNDAGWIGAALAAAAEVGALHGGPQRAVLSTEA